jgi:NADH-quinone oxidoreductase subunit C
MSEESQSKPQAASPAPAAAAAAAKKEPPPPPEPGKIGTLLAKLGLPIEHLGPEGSGKEQIRIAPENWLQVAEVLKDDSDCQFDLLVSLSAVDWKTHREAVYHFYSLSHHHWLVVKVKADAEDRIPSVYGIWPAVDWHEREAYDLMGILFDGHPDLKRILMPTDWEGHPLRKDYVENDPRLVWNRR